MMDVDNNKINLGSASSSSSGKKRGNEHLPPDDADAGMSNKRRQEGKEQVQQEQQEQPLLFCQELNNENTSTPPPPMANPPFRPFARSSSPALAVTHHKNRVDSHHSVLPLSMQVIKPFWLLCCQNCEETRNGRLHQNNSTSGGSNHLEMPHTSNGRENTLSYNSGAFSVKESIPSFMNQNGHIVDTTSNTNTVAGGGHASSNDDTGSTTAETVDIQSNRNATNGLTSLIQNHYQPIINQDNEDRMPVTSTNNDDNNSSGVGSATTPQPQLSQLVQTSDQRFQHLQTIPPTPKPQTNPIMQEYISTTQIYGCKNVNAGILTALRFSLPTLRVSGSFHDSDMLALSEILFRHCNGSLSHIKRLDFSVASREGKLHGKKGFGSHGAFTLSRVLCISQHIEEVFVQRNKIGPYGAAAMFAAVAKNSSLKTLVMRRCVLGERGALAFAEYIGQSRVTGLKEVDLSVNRIGFRGSIAIEEMLNEKEKNGRRIEVDLEGNLVLQEGTSLSNNFIVIKLSDLLILLQICLKTQLSSHEWCNAWTRHCTLCHWSNITIKPCKIVWAKSRDKVRNEKC